MKKITIAILFVGIAIAAAALFLPSDQTASLSDALVLGDDFQKYVNEKYGFSLEYPKAYTIEIFPEKDSAETIVFQGAEQQGFQIFITPFEEAQLTKERILRDIPGAILEGAQEAFIGTAAGQNIKALLFWSEDPLIGRTREAWFVHIGYLYEITAYESMDELLAGIMSTWHML